PALPTITSLDPVLVVQATLLGVLFALGLSSMRKRPWIAFGILWFFVQLAPTNSLVPRLDVANDRQLYLASWGLLLALCVQVARTGIPAKFSYALCTLVLALLLFGTLKRQLDYVDEVTLWEATVQDAPANPRARNNLGFA